MPPSPVKVTLKAQRREGDPESIRYEEAVCPNCGEEGEIYARQAVTNYYNIEDIHYSGDAEWGELIDTEYHDDWSLYCGGCGYDTEGSEVWETSLIRWREQNT